MTVALAVLLLGLLAAALLLGDVPVTWREVLGALTGRETGLTRTVVVAWRLPQAVAAVAIGAALACSGAIFQTVTRNPLGSPDVIGFATGSYTGALVALLFLGGGYGALATGAVVGGLATAGAVTALATRGGLDGFRLVLVGIAVSALLTAVNGYLLLTARVEAARAAAVWGIGSLNGVRWEQAGPTVVGVLVALLAVLPLTRAMNQLELGDALAVGTGVPVARTRWAMIAGGVTLVALGTAVTGPIAFIALAAPQIARRLTGAGRTAPASLLLTGAVLLLGSDLVATHAVPGVQLPVGVLTVCVGGLYLVWLLAVETRRSS